MDNLTLPEFGTKEHVALVALHNDNFRRWHCLGVRKPSTFVPGRSVWTNTFAAEDEDFKRAASLAIGNFDGFVEDNDPDGFHDFGAVEVDGRAVWFKIDHYDDFFQYGSKDPANLKVTKRLLTILFPSDW